MPWLQLLPVWHGQCGLPASNLGSIQSYVYMKVKLMFDPPQNSFTVDSMTKLVNELEWRLNVAADNSGEEVK